MSNALRILEKEGFELTADGDKLLVKPSFRLTDDLRDLIRANKAELLVAANQAKTRYMVRKRDPRNVAGWFIRYSTLPLEEFQAEMGEEFQVRVAKYQDEET